MDIAQDKAEYRPLGEGSMVDDIIPQTKENLSSQEKAMKGYPIQIIEIDSEDHSFKLNEDALKHMLSDDRIKDLPVCVVSVAGKKFPSFSRQCIHIIHQWYYFAPTPSPE